MCWRSVLDLSRYWGTRPPVHEMVAAYLGIKELTPPMKPLDVNELRAKGEAMRRAFEAGRKERLA